MKAALKQLQHSIQTITQIHTDEGENCLPCSLIRVLIFLHDWLPKERLAKTDQTAWTHQLIQDFDGGSCYFAPFAGNRLNQPFSPYAIFRS